MTVDIKPGEENTDFLNVTATEMAEGYAGSQLFSETYNNVLVKPALIGRPGALNYARPQNVLEQGALLRSNLGS